MLLHKPYRIVMCSSQGSSSPHCSPRRDQGTFLLWRSLKGKQARGSHRNPQVLPFLKAPKCTTNPFLYLKLLNGAKELRNQPGETAHLG